MRLFLLVCLCSSVLFSAELSQRVYKKLQKAEKHLELKEYAKAKTLLFSMKKLSEYERFFVLQAKSSLALAQENYKEAITLFEALLKHPELKQKRRNNLRYSLAQLYVQEKKYEKAIGLLKQYKSKDKKRLERINALLASLHFTLKKYKESVHYVDEAMRFATKPKRAYYDLKISALFTLKAKKSLHETLEKALSLWPAQKSYWLYLANYYQSYKMDKKLLAVYESMYKQKLLDSTGLSYYIGMLSNEGVYEKAGKLLESALAKKELKKEELNLKRLAKYQLLAKEHESAKAAMQELLALFPTEKNLLFYTQFLYNQEAFLELLKLLEKSKITLKKEKQSVLYLRALALFEVGKKEEAKKLFKRLKKKVPAGMG